jgi:hypothetical protein
MTATIDEGKLEQFVGAMVGHMTGVALCPRGRDADEPDPRNAPLRRALGGTA